jgi:nicotinamidase-related amidase
MQEFKPLRDVPSKVSFTNKDVLVVFGEVFARGYVNGLIDEAKKAGMKVIFSTVGRRDENDSTPTKSRKKISR